ncbi:MAG TPA: nucleotide exchange factor GrpE, partial [Pseudonocardiaceae bacterium]|nr:nucleotide exchange factor GrpE [Pseudonocardiaceae bacterium]
TGSDTSPEDQGAVGVAVPDRDAVAALEDRLRRALADLENLHKRHARELERERAAEANRVAGAWLPVLDNLDLALSHAGADPSTIIEGVRAVRDQALAVLANLGFSRYDEVGVPFDPARHEVINVIDDSDAEPGTVVRVLRPGYGTPERQLRPGAVTVAGRRS